MGMFCIFSASGPPNLSRATACIVCAFACDVCAMILRTLLSVNRSRHFANPYIFPNDQITSANAMPVETPWMLKTEDRFDLNFLPAPPNRE
jgi:hypothetical protein